MPSGVYIRTKPIWNKGLNVLDPRVKKYTLAKMGKKRPDITGKNNSAWKGNNVKYRSLHTWVTNNLGKPDTCEKCGANGLSGRKIHWSNKDHEYTRKRKDWQRLCTPCHKKYDMEKGLTLY